LIEIPDVAQNLIFSLVLHAVLNTCHKSVLHEMSRTSTLARSCVGVGVGVGREGSGAGVEFLSEEDDVMRLKLLILAFVLASAAIFSIRGVVNQENMGKRQEVGKN
jgi:hypothetical protein